MLIYDHRAPRTTPPKKETGGRGNSGEERHTQQTTCQQTCFSVPRVTCHREGPRRLPAYKHAKMIYRIIWQPLCSWDPATRHKTPCQRHLPPHHHVTDTSQPARQAGRQRRGGAPPLTLRRSGPPCILPPHSLPATLRLSGPTPILTGEGPSHRLDGLPKSHKAWGRGGGPH